MIPSGVHFRPGRALIELLIVVLPTLLLWSAGRALADRQLRVQQTFDLRNLQQFLDRLDYQGELSILPVALMPDESNDQLTGKELLGLRQEWLAYLVSAGGEYDEFVGASLTPRVVTDRLYDALVF